VFEPELPPFFWQHEPTLQVWFIGKHPAVIDDDKEMATYDVPYPVQLQALIVQRIDVDGKRIERKPAYFSEGGRPGLLVSFVFSQSTRHLDQISERINEASAKVGMNPKGAWAPIIRTLPPIIPGEVSPVPPIVATMRAAIGFKSLEIVSNDEAQLPRSERKRRARAGTKTPTVRVVNIRKVRKGAGSSEHVEASKIDWSCSWIVRGHWRSQWYASEKTHRPKYIEPYVKGDQDKPLKPATRAVFQVIR
jgi:hypothetical protein